jgi:hypothetical protein
MEDAAYATVLPQQAGALIVAADPYFNRQYQDLVSLSARHAIPAIYEWREFAEIGGLMSYGIGTTLLRRTTTLPPQPAFAVFGGHSAMQPASVARRCRAESQINETIKRILHTTRGLTTKQIADRSAHRTATRLRLHLGLGEARIEGWPHRYYPVMIATDLRDVGDGDKLKNDARRAEDELLEWLGSEGVSQVHGERRPQQ